jgi:glutamate/tyrosine decarboxylase-like PLP-dependent enzyme
MVTGGNVQIVWKKFLRYFDVEPRIVPLKPTIGLLGPIAASFPLALRR